MEDTELLSLDTPGAEPQEDLLSLDVGAPPLDLNAAGRRATEAHVGLGEQSPGLDVLKNRYLSGEGDKDIRQATAASEALANSRMRAEAIKDLAKKQVPHPDDPHIAAGIAAQVDEQDPDTILETKFADSMIGLGMKVFDGAAKVLKDGFGLGGDEALDMTNATRDAIAKRKVSQNLIEEDRVNQENTGLMQKTYEFFEAFVPGVSWYRIEKAAKDLPAGIALPGQTLFEIVSHANSLSPKEYYKYVYQVYDQLRSGSQTDATRFAIALESYSKSDAAFDNAMEIINVAASVPVASISKGVRGIAGAIGRKAGSGVAGIAEKALQASPTGSVKGFLKQLFRSADGEVIDAGRAASQLGDTATAARINAVKAVETGFKDIDPRMDNEYLRRMMPTLYNPKQLFADGSRFAAEITDRLITRMQQNALTISNAFKDPKVARGPEQALAIATKESFETILRDYKHINQSIVDIAPKVTRPDESVANVGSVSVYFGKPTGELFENEGMARLYAEQFYGVARGDNNIEQVGSGWAIRVSRDFDETTPAYRAAIATDKAPVRTKDIFLGWLRSAEDILSPNQNKQRKMAQHGSIRLHALAQDIAKDIKALPNQSKKDLSKILEEHRSHVGGTPERPEYGRFAQSISELDQDFQKSLGRLPTTEEIQAYYSYVALNDLDYTIRNMNLYKEKSRLGIREFSLYTGTTKGLPFEGKELDKFPSGFDKDAGLFIHTAITTDSPGEFRRLKVLDKGDQAEIQDLVKAGFKLIQVANPSSLPLMGLAKTDKPIHFVLTKSYQAEQLPWTQIPYRAGGHKDYAVEHFVKQPVIRRVADDYDPAGNPQTMHSYEGEKAAFGFHTEAEARKYTERMEQARQLMKAGKMDELEKYLEKNLPYTAKGFQKLFQGEWKESANGRLYYEKAHFSEDDPFIYLKSGRRMTDDYPDLSSQYANFEDNIRNPYNLYNQIDKKFAGERDPDLWTIREAGSEDNPVFHIESADMVDPLTSISGSMANVMRNRFMTDYKIQAIDNWIAQFGHLIKGADSIEEVRANPLNYFYKDTWDTSNPDVATLNAAKQSRKAIQAFLGEQTPMKREMNYLMEKVANGVYGMAGQKWGSFAAEHLPTETDPFRYARKFAFHLTMGMFNPTQFFAQANSMTHMIGIAGLKNGYLGTAAYMPIRALLLNDKPQMVEHFSNIAKALGWNKQDFIEMYQTLKLSGFHRVEGEAAWSDDMLEPKLFQNKVGATLDAANTFFKEGERVSRIGSWAAAFAEWKAKNPGKAVDNRAMADILNRADLMSVNMTRASNAQWNNGIYSIPTQFGSYSARLMEQFMGSRLTGAEKARLFATYSAMYGVPIGLTAGIPAFNWYGDARTELLQRGIAPDDGMIGLFMNGIPTTIAHVMGKDYNINERYGPGQFAPLKSFLESETSFDFIAGPSGKIISDAYKNASPLVYALTSPFRPEEQRFAPTSQDVIQTLQSISTVNLGVRTMAAMHLGLWMTKNGVQVTSDVDTFDALFTGITGTQPRNVSDTFLKMKNMKDVKNLQAESQKQINVAYNRAMQALINKDDATYETYMRQVNMWMAVGQFRPDQYYDVFSKAMQPHLDLDKKIDMDWFLKGPMKFHEERMKAYMGTKN